MLKIYKVHNYISINNSDWREVIWSWFGPIKKRTADEPLETKCLLHDVSFDEACEYLCNNELDGLGVGATFWRNKPTIWARYADAQDVVSYRHFNTISYKREYVEWTDVTLDWILNNLPADTVIQYLKERGITACPIMK